MSSVIQYAASITKPIQNNLPFMGGAKPNANNFEPFSLLTSIAMHTLYGEKDTKYVLSGRRLVPMPPSDYQYPVLPNLQGFVRTFQSKHSKDLVIIDIALKKFIEWHVTGEPDESIKQFLTYLVLGFASLKKTYEGTLFEANCESWIKLIWDAVLEPNQRTHEFTSTERKIIEIMRATGRLAMVNLLFESAMKELNITMTPLPSYELPFWSHNRQSPSMNSAPAEAASQEIEGMQEPPPASIAERDFAFKGKNIEPNPLQPKKEIRSKDDLYKFLMDDLKRIINQLQRTSPTEECTRKKCQRFINQFIIVQEGLEEAFDKVMAEVQTWDNPNAVVPKK